LRPPTDTPLPYTTLFRSQQRARGEAGPPPEGAIGHDDDHGESFFASLKKELVHDADFATREEGRTAIVEYIEVFYNSKRRHSSRSEEHTSELQSPDHLVC